MLDLDQLKTKTDKAHNHGVDNRDRAADDMIFAWVSQWDDDMLADSQLRYRGEFNVLRKAMREIIADLRSNPVQVNFEPVDEDRSDAADIVDGLYRADDRKNISLEAYDNAMQESVVCGIGGWVLRNEYKSNRIGREEQVINRYPIYEANTSVLWSPNAKLLDKSDADYCIVLEAYSADGFKDFVSSMTGEDREDVALSSFSEPETKVGFNWFSGDERYYIGEFYHKDSISDSILKFVDMFGVESMYYESQLEKEDIEELKMRGSSLVSERKIKRDRVTKYILTGNDILETSEVPGGHIPVIPVYGERAFVNGEERYEGITRLAKDPSRLRNFQLSYLADMVSLSPRQKPIFSPDQISGFEHMYQLNGSDNNYPYLLQHLQGENGEQLPVGPLGVMPEQPIPQALIASIDLTRQAIEDVAKSGAPQDIADPDLSGKAIAALQNKIEMQSMVFQQNMKHAKRRDAEIYAAMASVIYDTPRRTNIVLPDGTQKSVVIMEESFMGDGEKKVLNNIADTEFNVYADIGPSYTSRKEENRERLMMMINSMDQGDPLRNMLMLKLMQLTDGADFDEVRDYARKQLILQGIKDPETDEEKAMVQQAQQAQENQQDPNMLIGQAEMLKAQANMLREERETMKAQADIQNNFAKTQIDSFEAQTGRMGVMVDAEKANAELNLKRIDILGRQVGSQLRGTAARQ